MSERLLPIAEAIRISLEHFKEWNINKFATKEDLERGFQRVNPDWNQNDETAADYVKNRTHYEELKEVGGDTFTWDGNTEGREVVYNGASPYWYVSDAIVTIDDCKNGALYCEEGKADEDVTYEMILSLYQAYEERMVIIAGVIMCIPYDNFDLYGMVFPKAGLYIGRTNKKVSVTIPGYTGFKTMQTVVKTLDTEYLPEHLQFGTERAEVEVFPLADVNFAGDAEAGISPNSLLEGGKTYKVIWDSTEYTCDAVVMEDEGLEFVIAGNIAGLRELGNTGEPFVIMSYNSPEIDFVGTVVMSMWHLFDEPAPPAGSVSIAIHEISETVHKLDPKFLPMDDIFNEMESRFPSAEGGSY